MKKTIVLALILLGASCQNPPQKLSEQDIAAVRATMDKYVSAALAADWDAWGSTMATDAIFYPPNQDPITGREAIVAFGRAYPKLTSFTAPAGEITGYNDIAYAVGDYSLTVTLADSSSMSDQGSFIDTFAKQADGSWLYTRGIWHSNLPIPSPPPSK